MSSLIQPIKTVLKTTSTVIEVGSNLLLNQLSLTSAVYTNEDSVEFLNSKEITIDEHQESFRRLKTKANDMDEEFKAINKLMQAETLRSAEYVIKQQLKRY